MEMHHKLRRDPNWHPSACNICGQLGHQAAHCTNGTINWRQMYGDDAFRLKPPLYESEIRAIENSKKIDFEKLEKKSREYAASMMKGEKPPTNLSYPSPSRHRPKPILQPTPDPMPMMPNPAMPNPAMPNPAMQNPPMQNPPMQNPMMVMQQPPAAMQGPPPALAQPPPALPPGWAIAKDEEGRQYYWHIQTKKVTWEVPTASTPIEP